MQKFNYRPASVTVTLPDKKYIMKLAQNLMLFHTAMVGSVGSITIELQRAVQWRYLHHYTGREWGT